MKKAHKPVYQDILYHDLDLTKHFVIITPELLFYKKWTMNRKVTFPNQLSFCSPGENSYPEVAMYPSSFTTYSSRNNRQS